MTPGGVLARLEINPNEISEAVERRNETSLIVESGKIYVNVVLSM
jgi:hypothetical protein